MEKKANRKASRHSKRDEWLDNVLKEVFDIKAIHIELYKMYDEEIITQREYGKILLRIDPA